MAFGGCRVIRGGEPHAISGYAGDEVPRLDVLLVDVLPSVCSLGTWQICGTSSVSPCMAGGTMGACTSSSDGSPKIAFRSSIQILLWFLVADNPATRKLLALMDFYQNGRNC